MVAGLPRKFPAQRKERLRRAFKPEDKMGFEGAGIYNLHSPLIGKDGTIFVQKGTGDYMRGNDAIYALAPDGNV